MNSSEKIHDNLTVIKGIGPSRQRWLSESLGARTFHDLAALSAAEIETQLKAEGWIISRSEVDEWIAQAKELGATCLPSIQTEEAISTKAEAKANSPTKNEGEWKPFASFVVEFQTRTMEGQATERRTSVHYMEVDVDKVWPCIESEQLCQWMRDQVNGEMQHMPTLEQRIAAPHAESLPPSVDISQILLFQHPHADTPTGVSRPGQAFTGLVKGGKPFNIEVSFELTGPGVAHFAQTPTTFSVQFLARNLTLGSNIHLGETPGEALIAKETSHSVTLCEASLPTGLYRLWIIVTLHGTPAQVGFLEVPLLHVA